MAYADAVDQAILSITESSLAPGASNTSYGNFTMLLGRLATGTLAADRIDLSEATHMFMPTAGTIFVDSYEGNDYVSITPRSNEFKAYWGVSDHHYVARLGPGDDIITGNSSSARPLKAYVLGNDGFDYILQDLSTPGWSLSRPYSDASVIYNTAMGVEWHLFDDVEAIGSGDLWYLNKDMANNRFIPLTWAEVLQGGKSDPVARKPRRNRKKSGKRNR